MLLPKGKYTAAEEKVVQAYHKTIQLQVLKSITLSNNLLYDHYFILVFILSGTKKSNFKLGMKERN